MTLTGRQDNQDWPRCGVCGKLHRKERAVWRCWEKALAALFPLTRYFVRAYFPTVTPWPEAPAPIRARLAALRRQRWELQQRRPESVILADVPGFRAWVAAGLPGLEALRADIAQQIHANEPRTAPQVAAVQAYLAEVAAFQRAANEEINALRQEMGWPPFVYL